MKRIILLILFLVVVMSLMSSCSAEKGLVRLSLNDEGMFTADDGREYACAPIGYEPVALGDEYAVLDLKLEETLYEIKGLDPEKWLTTEIIGSMTQIYHSSDITLPTLEELGAETMYICETGSSTIGIATVGGENTEDRDADRALINSIVSALLDENAENELWPRLDSNEEYSLKLYSPDWPEIYYSLDYSICDSGCYVYDKISQKCVKVADVFEAVFSEAY